LDLADWLPAGAAGQRLVMHPSAGLPLARIEPVAQIELLVGPEGGFSDLELERLGDSGVQAVRLGPRTLRTETAAAAALAVLQAMFGDLGA
jgi:16S rRNA (uracil1498-N3)-methyltransferase